jgi:two-component system response regulator PilR (NtrC family)
MPQRILIVDDEDTVRTFLETLLRRAGYEVLVADSVREGRHVLKQGAPDLLITDVRLDGYNGLQLIATIDRPIPAIVITGFVDPVIAADAYSMGARVLAKPIVAAHLLALVNDLLPTVQEHEDYSGQERPT